MRTSTLLALLLPAGVFFAAFFLLPLARLFLVGGSGKDGFANYATIITDRNHFASLLATLALAAATTVVTLIVSGLAGVFLQRNKFPRQCRAGRHADLSAGLPRRGDRLHGDRAGGPPGTDRRHHARR